MLGRGAWGVGSACRSTPSEVGYRGVVGCRGRQCGESSNGLAMELRRSTSPQHLAPSFTFRTANHQPKSTQLRRPSSEGIFRLPASSFRLPASTFSADGLRSRRCILAVASTKCHWKPRNPSGGLGPSPTSPSTPPPGPVPWQMDGRTVTVSRRSWLGPVPLPSLPRYPPPPFVGLWSIDAGKEWHLPFPHPVPGSRFSFLRRIFVLGPCPAVVAGSLRPCFHQAHDVTSGPRRKRMMDIPSEGGPEWNRR